MKSTAYILASAILARAWQPPNHQDRPSTFAAQQHPFFAYTPGDDDTIDIATGSQFNGLETFANLPYVNALVDDEARTHRYDIAILGAPFDTATSGRPGARFGPSGIRVGSERMSPSATSVYTGAQTLADWAEIVDVGDVRLTRFDNTVALKQLDKAHRVSSH